MITIIHGEDTKKSREFYLEQKSAEKDPIVFSEHVTPNDLVQEFEGGGLFSEEKVVFFEHFFAKKKANSKDLKDLVTYLLKSEDSSRMYLWEGKELTKATLNLFPKATVKHFPLPKLLFSFLDALRPGNGAQLIKQFHELLNSSEAELVFFMMIRQFRILLAISFPSADGIDEVKRMAPWQRPRLVSQARLFSENQLKTIYQKLFAIDLAQKTGTNNLSLTQTIDFLLLDL